MEKFTNTPEEIPKDQREQFLEDLKLAKDKLEVVIATQYDFYSKEMYDIYAAMVRVTPTAREIYVSSLGFNYSTVIENYHKYENFRQEHLKPAEQEVMTIENKIRTIDINKRREEQLSNEIVRKEKFEKDKEKLSNDLYEALDSIHSQIPQEAKDAGLTIENALKVYLPGLVSKATDIEYYIGRLEEASVPLHLERIQDEIKDRRLF